jgi:hypothetical protein
LYAGFIAWFRKYFSQALYIDIDRALVDVVIARPNLRKQLRAVGRACAIPR